MTRAPAAAAKATTNPLPDVPIPPRYGYDCGHEHRLTGRILVMLDFFERVDAEERRPNHPLNKRASP